MLEHSLHYVVNISVVFLFLLLLRHIAASSDDLQRDYDYAIVYIDEKACTHTHTHTNTNVAYHAFTLAEYSML